MPTWWRSNAGLFDAMQGGFSKAPTRMIWLPPTAVSSWEMTRASTYSQNPRCLETSGANWTPRRRRRKRPGTSRMSRARVWNG